MEPVQQLQKPFVNPHARLSDYVPTWLKVFWKLNISPNSPYQTIIPVTSEHAEWILGVQPSASFIQKLSRFRNKTVRVISKLTTSERLITRNEREFSINTESTWGDHGIVDEKTGLNQAVYGMLAHIENVYKEFTASKQDKVFYCHCMAGKSRSFVETMALLHAHPELFDFDNWPPESLTIFTGRDDLKNRLKSNPSFSDIAEYVKLVRPNVKSFTKLDGEQAGLVGLMSLRRWAGDLDGIASRDPARRLVDIQNIGLMLKSPLDYGFRDSIDRKEQEQNLVSLYKAYQVQGVNLLMAMVVPIGETVDADYTGLENFKGGFNQLTPSEQARFAILLKALEDRDPQLDLGELRGKSLDFAKQAITNPSKLTAGDQVELLRAFGSGITKSTSYPGRLSYEGVVKKILKGSSVDRHNRGKQLAELLNVAETKEQKNFVGGVLQSGGLSYYEQYEFVRRLSELNPMEAKEYAKLVINNYDRRWFRFFYNPLQSVLEELKNIKSTGKPVKSDISMLDGSLFDGESKVKFKSTSVDMEQQTLQQNPMEGYEVSPTKISKVQGWMQPSGGLKVLGTQDKIDDVSLDRRDDESMGFS